MPVHNTATSYVGKKMSNGQPVQAHDVVGNDLVDELAKQIARRDALPRAEVQMVREAAACLCEAAVWIGRATVYANRCPLDVLVPVDPNAKRQYVRDSEAERPRRASGRKRKAEPADGARELSGQAAGVGSLLVPSSAAASSSGGKVGRPAAAATSAAAVWHQARAKKARVAQRLVAARDEAHLQDWQSRRSPQASAAAPAAERMDALRARIATKERHGEAAAASPGAHT